MRPTLPHPSRHFVLQSLLKNALKVLSRPAYVRALATAGLDARAFDLLHRRQEEGVAGRIAMASLQLTALCNLRCHTCGQWGDRGYLREADLAALKRAQVPTARYLALLRDLKDNGHVPLVHLWGGEPMLHPGTLDIIDESARLGMPPAMNTNGLRVAESAERLVAAPMFNLILSVDGSRAETHNAARPGAGKGHDNFATVVSALETVRAARERTGRALPLLMTNTVISRENFTDVLAIYERFRPLVDLMAFNLSYWIDAASAEAHAQEHATRFGRRATTPFGWVGEWHQFDVGELSRQLREVLRRSGGPGGIPVSISPALTSEEDLRRYYTDHSARFGHERCRSIFQIPEVDPVGDVYPCRDYHDYAVGNVQEHTLSELWNSERFVAFRRGIVQDGLLPACNRCCGLMGYPL